MKRRGLQSILAAVAWLALGGLALAQAQPARPAPVIPDDGKILAMVRNTLVTLSDAMKTGNFTVLRDSGSIGFREFNSAAKLTIIFSDLSARNLDLSAVTVVNPEFTEKPSIDAESGMLHLKGKFPKPVEIDFEMLYESVDDGWKLFGISVQPGPPATAPDSASKKPEDDTAAASKKN